MAIDDNTSYELTGYQVKDLAQKVRAKADSSSLANIATSGLYSDLIGAPTIPTVYNGTLTITQGGDTLGTFTANSSTNETIDIPAGGSTYTAGNGISISANDEISIDTSVVAELSDLPTVYNGELTIQHNGTTEGTFTANSSTNQTVNIETIYADTIAPATSVAPISTSMIADGAVTGDKIASATVTSDNIDWTTMPDNYSTSEIVTGSTWIDGKPIYKKTVNIGTLPNTASKSVAHGVSNLATFVRMEGIATEGSPLVTAIPLPFVGSTTAGGILIRIEPTTITIITNTDRSSFSGYVTLWYTKTTD